LREANQIIEEFKTRSGQVLGGTYAGISFIPGDPNKPWVERDREHWESKKCPACVGVLRYLYQTSDEEVDGEFRTFYKSQCRDCNYLDDVGVLMTQREIRASRYVYCDVVKGTTFNRTGHSCDFIDPIYNEPVTRMDNWCDECPHPH